MVKRIKAKKPFEKLIDIEKRKEVKDMMAQQKDLKDLFDEFKRIESQDLPKEGELPETPEGESLKVPEKKGVYIIFDAEDNVLYAGSTKAKKFDIDKEFQNQMNRKPPVIEYDFARDGEQPRKACKFKYIEKPDDEIEAYVKFLYCISPIPPQSY